MTYKTLLQRSLLRPLCQQRPICSLRTPFKRAALERRLAELAEEYTVASNQLGRMLNDGDTLKLQRQIAHIEHEMQQIAEALHERN